MKRIKKLFSLFIVTLIIPFVVHADCGNIIYKDYRVKVSNKNGATTYDINYNEETKKYEYKKENFVIPYGEEVLIVIDGIKTNDIYFLSIEYKEEIYSVKSSDLINIKEFKKEKIELENSKYYTVKDVEVRKGPGVLYDVAGTIKADTNIKLEKGLNLENRVDSQEGAWIYISDGKVSGYIYHEMCKGKALSLGTKVNYDIYYLGTDEKEFTFGEKLNIKYIVEYAHDNEYYIEKNNKQIILKEEFVGTKYEHKLKILALDYEYLTLKSLDNDKELEKKDYLTEGKEYNIKYYNSDGYTENYFIEINNKMYILSNGIYDNPENLDYSLIVYEKEDKYTFDEERYYRFETNKEYQILEKGKEIVGYKLLNDDDIYYNKELGFIYKNRSEIEEESEEENKKPIYVPKNEPDNDIKEVEGISVKDYILLCLGGAVAISIIAIIILICINKNKNKERDNS
ncbi:MAG: hypothetical protein IJO57_04870 [Bacilli bacterium]|nr:hypothetical protein [Bacilli bacterium]